MNKAQSLADAKAVKNVSAERSINWAAFAGGGRIAAVPTRLQPAAIACRPGHRVEIEEKPGI